METSGEDYLQHSRLLFDVSYPDTSSLISAMVETLVTDGRLSDRAAALSSVLDREKVRPTGLSLGIACPHGFVTGLSDICVVVARLATPLDFGAGDGVPARHVFLVLSPKTATGGPHIKALASIVRCYRNARLVGMLDAAGSAEEYFNLLTGCLDA